MTNTTNTTFAVQPSARGYSEFLSKCVPCDNFRCFLRGAFENLVYTFEGQGLDSFEAEMIACTRIIRTIEVAKDYWLNGGREIYLEQGMKN